MITMIFIMLKDIFMKNKAKSFVCYYSNTFSLYKISYYESWTKLLLNPILLKDESLWSSQWCLIRTHHNYP